MTHQKYVLEGRGRAHYDELYDHLSQFKPDVNSSKAKKVIRNHDPLALFANPHAHSSHSYASPPYFHSPQPYYVTHLSSVIDYEDDYQGEIQGDAREDKLTTAMMLLARAITQRYSNPNNNRLRTSSNTKKSSCDPRCSDHDAEPTYDTEIIIEVNASQIDVINGLLLKSDHGQHHHEKLKTLIHTSADDQIDSDIIFDDPYMEKNNENQRKMNIELKKQKELLERELETYKEWVKDFENKLDQFLNYKEAYEELQNEINVEKEQLFIKKEEIHEQLLQTQDEILKIKYETDLYKKAFKAREDKYLEDIVTL
nr:hypothetical protein [Tanacetum cinerariifolium]